jgi:hypothetical protein
MENGRERTIMMTTSLGVYDSDLQMFVDPPHDLNRNTLTFWWWRVRWGELDDDVLTDDDGWRAPHPRPREIMTDDPSGPCREGMVT